MHRLSAAPPVLHGGLTSDARRGPQGWVGVGADDVGTLEVTH
jgi:hypothetical protein